MKKKCTRFLFIISFVITAISASAQANLEAGIRGGGNWSIDATLPIGKAPRLHPAVYLDNFGIAGYFDWMFALSNGPTGLKFYPGVGPEFWFENDFDIAVAGNFGSEYSFKFPLTIGIDWRPGFVITDSFDFKSGNWGFLVRYRFGEGKFQKAN